MVQWKEGYTLPYIKTRDIEISLGLRGISDQLYTQEKMTPANCDSIPDGRSSRRKLAKIFVDY